MWLTGWEPVLKLLRRGRELPGQLRKVQRWAARLRRQRVEHELLLHGLQRPDGGVV